VSNWLQSFRRVGFLVCARSSGTRMKTIGRYPELVTTGQSISGWFIG